MVGLIPLLPVASIPEKIVRRSQALGKRFAAFMEGMDISGERLREGGYITGRRGHEYLQLSVVPPAHLGKLLGEMLSEDAFLSPHGLRALSKRHRDAPFKLELGGLTAQVDYEPGESTSGLFGGNSNWRGPVWMPTNYMVIVSLWNWDSFMGDDFLVEYPTGSGTEVRLRDVSEDIARRLVVDLAARREGPAAGLRHVREVPDRPGLARPAVVPRVLPRRHRGRHRRLAPDGLDRARGTPPVPRRAHRHDRERPRDRPHGPGADGDRCSLQAEEGLTGGRRNPVPRPVRADGQLPFHLPAPVDGARVDARGHRRHLRPDEGPEVAPAVVLLGQGLRAHLRPGRRHRHRPGIRVRDELGRLLAVRRQRVRQPARGRGRVRVLPRGWVPRPDALRREPARARGCGCSRSSWSSSGRISARSGS